MKTCWYCENGEPRDDDWQHFYGGSLVRCQLEPLEELMDDRLLHIFTYHAPTAEQLPKYQKLREAALAFAEVIVECTPPCPDQTVAIRKIREAVMTANSSIALNGIS